MALKYSITFAGIPFVPDMARVVRMNFARPEQEPEEGTVPSKHQSEADLVDEVNRLIDMRLLQDMALPRDRNRSDNALARVYPAPDHPGSTSHVGEWYYPVGASRWSVFRGLATAEMAKAMQDATGGNTPRLFSMQVVPITPNPYTEDSYKVETFMYMLPPRPLAQHGGALVGLYLITLVDARYYWQYDPVTLNFDGASTWADLLSLLATALGAQIDYSSIAEVYSQPERDSQLWTMQGDAPALLDAIAGNLGRVVVRELDGSYTLLTPQESLGRVNLNRQINANVTRIAGGEIFNSGLAWTMPGRNAVVPATVNVVFPQYVMGNDPVPHLVNNRYRNQRPSAWFEDGFGGAYTVAVPIQSGTCYSGSLTSGLLGVSQQTIWDTAKALYSGEANLSGQPLNASGLTALSMQIARDVYDWQALTALDEVIPGTVAWAPEGFHDIVWTWSVRKRQASTRVMRTEWNQAVPLMQHTAPALSGWTNIPPGVGGPSVAQSWQDSFSMSGGGLTALRLPLVSGDAKISVTNISYWPTQNRFKLLIGGQERVLVEGTSGKSYFDIVQRGIDGTVQRDWPAGTNLRPDWPDATYGVNCVTIEKGQFAFPAEATSGGVAGLNLVPQIQTVKILDVSGKTLDVSGRGGVRSLIYSGVVITQWPNGTDLRGELVWVRDRNYGQLPYDTKLGGQLIGYSAATTTSGGTAPIYVVDPQRKGFWARLTAVADSGDCLYAYSFKEVTFSGCVTSIKADGIQGEWDINPAYEVSGNSTLLANEDCGAVVWMRWDVLSDSYRFSEYEELVSVKLLALAGAGYAFIEVQAFQNGQFTPRSGGRSGIAYELNKNLKVPINSVVWARKRILQTCVEWEFQYEGGGSSSTTTIVNIYNYTTTITNISTIDIIDGVEGGFYFVCDGSPCMGDSVNCTLYIWVCRNGICGFYDICTCTWYPRCYWCVGGECVTSYDQPENSTGPYTSEAACQEACSAQQWWCVENTESACNACPEGACVGDGELSWEYWSMDVLAPMDPAYAELGGYWQLNPISDCLWATGTGTELPRWTLGWSGSEMLLQWFASDGTSGTASVDAGNEFLCCSPYNIMYPVYGDGKMWPAGYGIPLTGYNGDGSADCSCEEGSTTQTITCITADTQPANFIGGPYDSQDACRSSCASTDLWWCVPISTTPTAADCNYCCDDTFWGGNAPGYPSSWAINVPVPLNSTYNAFADDYTLSHGDGCVWTSGTSFPKWTLSLTTSGWMLIGQLSDGTTVQGSIPQGAWQCCGANLFDAVTPSGAILPVWNQTNPITATPVGDCSCEGNPNTGGDTDPRCGYCDSGEPNVWLGLVISGATGDFSFLNGTWGLGIWEQQNSPGSGCIWYADDFLANPYHVWTLSRSGTNWFLVGQTGSADVNFTGTSADCCSEITLTYSSISGTSDPWTGPTTITLTVGAEGTCSGSSNNNDNNNDAGYECVQSASAPAGSVGQGHQTQGECEAACVSSSNPYWCVNNKCVQAAEAPPGSTGVQYNTLSECQVACEGSGGGNPYWCVGGSCVQSATEPEGSTGIQYNTQSACEGGCSGGAITTICCPDNPLPAGATLTVTDGGAADGSYAIAYDPEIDPDAVGHTWVSDQAIGTCPEETTPGLHNWYVTCPVGASNWVLTVGPTAGVYAQATLDCAAGTLTFTNVDLSGCGGGANATVTVQW